MRRIANRNVTVFAALAAVSLVATPLVMGASSALATAENASPVAVPAAVVPVDLAPIAAPRAETCARRVRVVYSNGYGNPGVACPVR